MKDPSIIPDETFCQQDYLRCKAYFTSLENITKAIENIKSNFPFVRIKNRLKFLGDIMINFKFGELVAEC